MQHMQAKSLKLNKIDKEKTHKEENKIQIIEYYTLLKSLEKLCISFPETFSNN